LFTRLSGTAAGYAYSAAMTSKQVKWSEEEMFVYLENPKKYVPGTKMVFAGFKKAQDRAGKNDSYGRCHCLSQSQHIINTRIVRVHRIYCMFSEE
jgi:hypothetical protein